MAPTTQLTRTLTIVSGGQTGADRAALDFAIEHGFAHDGWCPRGRRAEDGPLDEVYQLKETPSHDYAQRTRRNVRESDVTVVFTTAREATGGTALTLALADRFGRPCLHLAREDPHQGDVTVAAEQLRRFLSEHGARRVNIAGPRESQDPAVARFVHQVLAAALLSRERDSQRPLNGSR